MFSKYIVSALLLLSTACSSLHRQASTQAPLSSENLGSFPDRDLSQYQATGSKFMVVSQGVETTRIARSILEQGGNAYDAFVAASFAIAVERPQSTGLGGGGFLVSYDTKRSVAQTFDFREKAPLKAHKDMFLDGQREVIGNASTEGVLANGVPGMVKGVLEIHRRYGSLPLSELLKPAADLARDGYEVYPHLAKAIDNNKTLIAKFPTIKRQFFDEKGEPLQVGDKLQQPDLAKTISLIAKKGADVFYKGEIARAIVSTHKKHGGLISSSDLSRYEMRTRVPVKGQFGDYTVYSMGPPSSGGTHIVELLNIVEALGLKRTSPYGLDNVQQTVAAMGYAFRDRARYMGDSDFNAGLDKQVKQLTSEHYAQRVADAIRVTPMKALKLAPIPEKNKAARLVGKESPETSHFTIADGSGTILSSTQTINGWFGSKVFVEGYGFALNNEMDDFSAKPGVPNQFGVVGGAENSIEPGKRMLSSMAPTVVVKGGKPVLALGSPAGSKIITCVALTSLNYLYYDMPLVQAVNSLRYHFQWQPRTIVVEEPGFRTELAQALRASAHELETKGLGCKVQAISLDPMSGVMTGVSDLRGEGLAASEAPVPPLTGLSSQDPNEVQSD